jgi:hypothetical protein
VLREPRWSAWRVGLIGVIAWHALVLIAAILRQSDFKNGLFHGWWFPFEMILLLATAITFVIMEARVAKSSTAL